MIAWFVIGLSVAFTITALAYSLCYSSKEADNQSEKMFEEENKDGN